MQAETRTRRPTLLQRLARFVRRRPEDRRPPVPRAPLQVPRPTTRAERRPVLYAAADAGAASPIGDWLRAAGYRIVPVEGFGLAIGELMAHRAAFTMLIVDIDGFGGPGLVADRLLDLRRKHPSLPVIVISGEVRFNDFTTERLTLCDVTLRAPVSAPALELALAEAAVNNLLWQARNHPARTGRPAEP